jgi:hypothetical protein
MEKQMIQGFWRGNLLVRCEQQQAIKPTCEGDGLGWAKQQHVCSSIPLAQSVF